MIRQAALLFCVIAVGFVESIVASEIEILSGRAMGTSYTLKIASRSETTSFEEAGRLIKNELERIEAIFSLYRPESELSRWNEAPADVWIDVSDDLYSVTQFAMELSRETHGAFDPTIRPLMKLWQLDSLASSWTPPSLEAIEETRKSIGADQIAFRTAPRAMQKRIESIQLDLNALVEGWAIDRIVSLLEANGFRNALFEIGGEFGSIGKSTESTPWQVGIEDPRNISQPIAKVPLSGESLCTSGSTKQGRVHNGNRYSHILDARTGRPIDHDLAAVSVLHSEAMVADGWSTALLVLGPKESLLIAERKGLAAISVRVTPQGSLVSLTANGANQFHHLNDGKTRSLWPNGIYWGLSVFALLGIAAVVSWHVSRSSVSLRR
jgi:FAD:protein FMN transferase